VEILEFFTAGAEFDIPLRPAGRPVVHGASSSIFAGTLTADKPEKLPL
jgi:hypothetical protein